MKHISNGISDTELRDYLADCNPTIIECGAHDGRDTERFLNLFPTCKVIAFEPDPRPLLRTDPPGFMVRINGDPRVTLVTAAVSDKSGTAKLFRSSGTPPRGGVNDWDHSSSLRQPTGHLTNSPWCTFPEEKQLEVRLVTLDNCLVGIQKIDLLWVDVQGGQIALINGSKQTLAKTRLIYMECHKTPMYDGEPTQDELVKIMQELGFEVVALYEGYNFLFQRASYEHR